MSMNAFGKIEYLLGFPKVYKNFLQGYASILGFNPEKPCYRLRNGLKIFTAPSKWAFFILNEIFIIREYDVALSKEPEVIIDIGANIGATSLFFSQKFPKAKIYSIEPFPGNFALLEKNIKANGLSKRVKAFNIAIGGSDRKGTLFLNELNDGGHSIVEGYNKNAKQMPVSILSFESFMKRQKISRIGLLKIDVEAAELQILKSMKSFQKIDNIVLECTDTAVFEKISRLLKSKGYSVGRVEGRPLIFARRD